MRMRPKKNRVPRMEAVKEYLAEFDENNKSFDESENDIKAINIEKSFPLLFQKSIEKASDIPVYLEIGCGKGSFITALSKREPQCILIGMEKVFDVILLAMEKAKKENCGNIRFVMADVENIDRIIPHKSIDKLFINFCDPWPKKRNAKRRLTFNTFLEKYKQILKPEGKIFFKTDNRPLFDFSIEEFRNCGYTLENICYDLHSSSMEKDNIHTEYEDNFSAKGFTINYLEAKQTT